MAGPGKHRGLGELTAPKLDRRIGTVTYRILLDPAPDGALLCHASLVPAGQPVDPVGTEGTFQLTLEDSTTIDLSLQIQERNGRIVYCGAGRVRVPGTDLAVREATVA